jgi:hypothetical protein
MVKRQKDIQYNGQKTEGHTIQWSKDRRIYNTMVKRQKDIQYNGQKTEGHTIQWSKDRRTYNTIIVLYVLLSFDHCIVCPSVF